MRIAMLAPRMTMGHGVAEAVAMQVRGMRAAGVDAVVGCLEYDDYYSDVAPQRVAPDPGAVRDFASNHGAAVIIGHGSPYFEVLPAVTGPFHTIVYEYGDPNPELFDSQAAARRGSAGFKRRHVYPNVSRVAAISRFIRKDIDWPGAHVIVLGIEHVPDLGPKPADLAASGRPMRVGALMRMGAGEFRYKGPRELRELSKMVPDVQWELAGRGCRSDARGLQESGFLVHLNPSDTERSRFLREVDVFVTTSLWEGTNLPLVEAEALGTPGLALDVAAHPEFTPFVFDSLEAMAAQLISYRDNRQLVSDAGRRSYDFVRERMSWDETVAGLLTLCGGSPSSPPAPRSRLRQEWARLARVRTALGEAGMRETVSDQWRRRRGH